MARPTAGLHLAHEEHPDADQQQHREPGQQVVQDVVAVILGLGDDAHTLVGQLLHQRRVIGGVGLERRVVIGHLTGYRPSLDHNVVNAICIHVAQEVGIRDLLRAALLTPWLKQVEQHHQQQGNDHPECEVAAEIAHLRSLVNP